MHQPLFWAALSDQYGRKRMYLISGLINIVCCIICAISKNIAMLIVFRGLQSFGANAGLTLGNTIRNKKNAQTSFYKQN